MSLIQDPVRALRQARWYLANPQLELMPTAFSLAAGNLLRQFVEQVFFALAFYGGVPRNRYMRSDCTLRTAGTVLRELKAIDSAGRTYLQHARASHPYLRRIARPPATLQRWINALNDPSHFGNPAMSRRTRRVDLETLTGELEALVDQTLFHLVIAAANELRTRGKLRAVLGTDPNRTVALQCEVVVRPKHLMLHEGELTLSPPSPRIRIVSSEIPEPVAPSRDLVMVQHQTRPALQVRLTASDGHPIDLTTPETMLSSLARTPARRGALLRRLRQLGVQVSRSP